MHTSPNTNLEHLICFENRLTHLDVSQQIGLEIISCNLNQLVSLNLGQQPNLEYLACNANYLKNVDISQCTALRQMICNENYLEDLDVSPCVSLTLLRCNFNRLMDLNVKNGNNTILYLNATANPDLTCVRVDDSTYSTNNWLDIDPVASFSESCGIFDNIKKIKQLDNVSIYPNPTPKKTTIDFGKFYREAKVEVRNVTGQTILSKTVENASHTSLELDGATGVYFVRLQTEEGAAVFNVMKE